MNSVDILFAEKLKHGTISVGGERRTLFYKYVPFGMHVAPSPDLICRATVRSIRIWRSELSANAGHISNTNAL